MKIDTYTKKVFKRQRFTCMISRGYNIRQTYTNKRIDMLTPTGYTLPVLNIQG